MKAEDEARVRRVIVALSAAIEIFRTSKAKACVGDIEAESQLRTIRSELRSVLQAETRHPWR